MDSDFRPASKPAKSVTDLRAALDAKTETTRSNMQTPARLAVREAVTPVVEPPVEAAASDDTPKPSSKSLKQLHRKFILHWPPHKKEYITAGALILLCSLGGIGFLTRHNQKPVAAAPKPAHVKQVAPAPTTVPSTLSGLPVAPSVNQQPVTGVMIENSVQARPQSGLSQAGVVFEAIAEGGITRFLALFQDTAPDNVGPIRSARPYYEQWALGFDAGYAHVGGSPEALQAIKDWGVRDLDQFYNSGSYHRISSRAAPHNVYTAVATLQQLEAAKGYTSSKFTGFARKVESPAKQVTAKSINVNISGPTYNTHYDYDAPSNSYKRSEGGAAHIDANTNTQISPKVVVALVMPYSLEADGYHSSYNTIGSGQVYVFQDGAVTVGQWKKTAMNSQFTFTDGAGKPIKLNAGQTWLTAVGAASNVTFAP